MFSYSMFPSILKLFCQYQNSQKRGKNFQCLYWVNFMKSHCYINKNKNMRKEVWKQQEKKILWGRRKRMEATLIVPIKLFGLEIVHWILSMLYLLLLYCPFSYECTFRLFFFYYFMNIAKSSSTSNRLIKHLIKYRYKSNIFLLFP